MPNPRSRWTPVAGMVVFWPPQLPPKDFRLYLSKQQLAELKRALETCDFTRESWFALVRSIECHLSWYRWLRIHEGISRALDLKLLHQVKQAVKDAHQLTLSLEREPLRASFERGPAMEEFRRQIQEHTQRWEGYIRFKSQPSRPVDNTLMCLAREVLFEIERIGISLDLSRRSDGVAIDVMRILRRWADRLDGRKPKRYTNIYYFTKSAIEWRRAKTYVLDPSASADIASLCTDPDREPVFHPFVARNIQISR
jgi:hypothetical protein